MTTHSSATMREEKSHVSDSLRHHAQSIINNRSFNPEWRNIIRYALEINDPWLADLVRRADAGETIIDTIDFSQTPESNEDDLSDAKIESLAEIICVTDLFPNHQVVSEIQRRAASVAALQFMIALPEKDFLLCVSSG